MTYKYIDITKNDYLLLADGDKASIIYNNLTHIFPDWASQLHKNGHNMDESQLEIIAKYGIIQWYFNNILGATILNSKKETLTLLNKVNIYNISYYEWKNIFRLCYIFKIPIKNIYIDELYTKEETSFNMVIKIAKLFNTYIDKMDIPAISIFMKKNITDNDILSVIDLLKDKVNDLSFNMYNCDHIKDNMFEVFYNNNKDIRTFGILFQRTKIIDEKLNKIISDKNTKKECIKNDISKRQYIYNLCNIFQNTLYSYVKSYLIDFPYNIHNVNINDVYFDLNNKNVSDTYIKYFIKPCDINNICIN